MMASGENRLSTTTMRRMPVLAQSQTTGGGTTVWNDPNDASAGLVACGDCVAGSTAGSSSGPSNPSLFPDFLFTGMAGGAVTGTALGIQAASYAAPAAAAEMAGTSGSIVFAPMAAADALSGLSISGLTLGAAGGAVFGVGAFSLYMMTTVPPPPNGSYGPPYGNFPPY
jgi:hypothetical protein